LIGCGCDTPEAEDGYDCDGNELPEYQIGDLVEGGIVYYVDETGGHGLVAALEDLPGVYAWGCTDGMVSGADGTAIGTGLQNTLDIVNGCSDTNSAGYNAFNASMGGYEDWCLPSKDELIAMYNGIGNAGPYGDISNFGNGWYWSSTELDDGYAYTTFFANGYTTDEVKSYPHMRILVVRSF